MPVDNLADLLAELDAGHPVLVFQNLALDWSPQWHFAVAVGYDLDSGDLILRSGTERRRVTRLSTFEFTWRRGDYWALVVLPPDRLPAATAVPGVRTSKSATILPAKSRASVPLMKIEDSSSMRW